MTQIKHHIICEKQVVFPYVYDYEYDFLHVDYCNLQKQNEKSWITGRRVVL